MCGGRPGGHGQAVNWRGLGRGEEEEVGIPYTMASVGDKSTGDPIRGDAEFEARNHVDVPSLHAADYGQVLPASIEAVGLWWCSSGWKVSSQRPVPPPNAQAAAMRIAAAANEAEAAQLVVRPARTLRGLTVTAGELTGPSGAKIAAEQIDILRVRYVSVTQPTDATSTVGLWPDPLPPHDWPRDSRSRSQSAAVGARTCAARSAAGNLSRRIALQADDFRAEVPLHVKVFGFTMPDRMTCQTAFGFDPSEAWRYHGAEDGRTPAIGAGLVPAMSGGSPYLTLQPGALGSIPCHVGESAEVDGRRDATRK